MLDQVRCLAPSRQARTRFGEVPRYPGGLHELARGVYAWMVPNGSWGEANMGLISGDGRSVLVDTPWDLTYAREMLEAMHVVTERDPIKTVVNTHSDGDHCWGNQLFENEEIVASAAAASAMRHVTPASLTGIRRLGQLLGKLPVTRVKQIGSWFHGMTAPYDFAGVRITRPNHEFSGELVLDVSGRTVVVRELGPAHTDGDSVVFVPDAGVLFTGDLLFIDSTPVIWAGPVENWIAALDAILAYEARVIVPGHGPLTTRSGVLRVRDYLELVSEETLKLFAQGVPPRITAARIAASPRFAALGYLAWDSPERIMTTVHTIYRNHGYRQRLHGNLAKVRVLASQAELAFQMQDATPRSMHATLAGLGHA
jgi:cyclase